MHAKVSKPLSIENEFVRFTLSPTQHSWLLEDKRAGVSWGSAASIGPWVNLLQGEERIPISLSRIEEYDGGLRCRFVRHGGRDSGLAMVFRLVEDALQVYLVPDHDGLSVELFGTGLEAGAEEDGEALLPIRMGLLLPAQGARTFEMTFGTYEYEGLHMAVAAMFKGGAALMAAWHDPYIKIGLARRFEEEAPRLRMHFVLSHTARSLELRCLGKGDLHTVAAAYRRRAEQLGYRVPWREKLKDLPSSRRAAAEKLFGACNFKLWTALARKVDENLVEQSAEVHWTFDEAAQIAEHLKHDLKLQDVLFHLGGWTRYGYDCRHPDIMPANPECGGNEGLIDCARRVQNLGYTFCLHDNVQDMYRDAPSWDEYWIQKQADGSLVQGGVWLGGRAYYTCAREALQLAKRPQNLPEVAALIKPDAYFIDTTYAVGPQECFDPRHPLTRQQDIQFKAELSEYARQQFGLFGSECGREWAVPHADFFEGLASVSGDYYHMLKPENLDGRVVPFFDMVFHDCIVIHGKYGYQPAIMAEQVIHHAAMGRTLYYHSVGNHLYWQDPAMLPELLLAEGAADPALYTRASGGWAEGHCVWDRFIKNTQEILGPLNKRTSLALIERYDFLDADRRVRRTTFDNGVTVVVNGSSANYKIPSPLGGDILLPPFGLLVEAGDFAAFVALAWGGQQYDSPVLFTLTSSDGTALQEARQIKVFHGFGSPDLRWQEKSYRVEREAFISE
jgi:hypothetical protein